MTSQIATLGVTDPILPFSVPDLRWKPNRLHQERSLKSLMAEPLKVTLPAALVVIKNRSKKEVLLITKIAASDWILCRYKPDKPAKVSFQKLNPVGLPLGGNPLVPNTFVADSSGQFARLVRENNQYKFKSASVPGPDDDDPGLFVESAVPRELTNDGQLLHWSPSFELRPLLKDLHTAMSWIKDSNLDLKIKAAGAQHSWSQIAVTDGVYISPKNMKEIALLSKVHPTVYKSDRAGFDTLVRAGSGTTIREANSWLWKKDLAFAALGGYDGQTFGGVFNTGTHGSVFAYSHLAEIIQSLDVVLFSPSKTITKGKTILRVEPTDGITDPKLLAERDQTIHLEQDDATFNAFLINMGTMGIVRSIVFKAYPMFYMREVRTATTIDALQGKLKGNSGIYRFASTSLLTPQEVISNTTPISTADAELKDHPLPAYHLELLFNPHGQKAIVTSRQPIPMPMGTPDSDFADQPPGRDLTRTILRPRFSRPALPVWFQENFSKLLTKGIDFLAHINPRGIPGLIDSSMDTLPDDAYVDRSFNVFNIGAGTNSIPALSCTIFVPLAGDAWITAWNAALAFARTSAEKRKEYETAPVSIRFVRKSRAMLGLPEDCAAFEFIFTASTKYAQTMVDGYYKAMKDATNGVAYVHWGQMMSTEVNYDVLAKMYPHFKTWVRLRNALDEEGRFLSEWQEKLLRFNKGNSAE